MTGGLNPNPQNHNLVPQASSLDYALPVARGNQASGRGSGGWSAPGFRSIRFESAGSGLLVAGLASRRRASLRVVVRGRGDRQVPADRLDPEPGLVLIDVGDHLVGRRSSPTAKKAEPNSVSSRSGHRRLAPDRSAARLGTRATRDRSCILRQLLHINGGIGPRVVRPNALQRIPLHDHVDLVGERADP